jgi:SAM-dependent methyltransferase
LLGAAFFISMQARHKKFEVYFEETSVSCRKYYIPFLVEQTEIVFDAGCDVLEIGCGIGGILSAFAEKGCRVTGVDIHRRSIDIARALFAGKGMEGQFICSDIFDYDNKDQRYDLIILHDSIEHIGEKEKLMISIRRMLKKEGVLYIGFPPWQMPFGGHQQMAKNKLLAYCPYIHLLPKSIFRLIFRIFRQSDSDIKTFLDIRATSITIEQFEKLLKTTLYNVICRQLYFINPNYHIKFGIPPRKLSPVIAKIPYVRNFVTTTCYYVVRKSL